MSTEIINKAVVSQFITELFENFSDEHMPLLLTDDFRAHSWRSDGSSDGEQRIGQILTLQKQIFRNPRVTVQDLITQDDKVVARYLFEAEYTGRNGISRNAGQRVRMSGILIARVRNQKIAECWWEEDRLGMLQQLRAA